jgi:hypothetical protein
MSESLLDQYKSYHPEFIESLAEFSQLDRKKILSILQSESNKNNFLSTVCEIKFGKFFIELGFQTEYNVAFPNNQRPDWILKADNMMAICDVYRLGQSEKDQARSDFEYKLMELLEGIQLSYFLRISFKQQYFNTGMYDPESIGNQVSQWLMSSPKNIGEKIFIEGNFEFEVVESNTGIDHVCCAGNASSIDIKPHKLKQSENLRPNEITKKLTKYNSLISEYNIPFFLCVYIDFVSGFGHREFREYFLGRGVHFADFGKPIANHPQFRHLGEEWTEFGAFYDNLQLSGVITYYNGEFRILLNPQKAQILYSPRHASILQLLNRYRADSKSNQTIN